MARWIIFAVLFGLFILMIPFIREGLGTPDKVQLIAPLPDPASDYVLGIAWAAISKRSGNTTFVITDAGWVIDVQQHILLLTEITFGETIEYWEVKMVWDSSGDITAKWAARIK